MKKGTTLNSFGERWEVALLKRGTTNLQALQLLRRYPALTRLDRSAIYRWTTRKSDRIPKRARMALAILSGRVLVRRHEKTLAQAWAKEMLAIQDELKKIMRRIGKLKARIRLFGL